MVASSEEVSTHPLLPRFRLRQRVAAGPHGTCYVAVDEESGAHVLLYDLKGLVGDPDRLARMRARVERSRLARDPGIILPSSVDLDGARPFIAMPDLRKAPTLADASTLSEAAAVRAVTDLVSALAAGHRTGLVHGRVQPSRVWLVDERPKIDFLALRAGAVHPRHALDAEVPLSTTASGADEDVAQVARVIRLLTRVTASKALASAQVVAALDAALVEDAEARVDMSELRSALIEALEGDATVGGASGAKRTAPPTDDAGPADRQVLFGRFEIEAVLGQGAIGRVLQARDRVSGERVALKVLLRGGAASAKEQRRFMKEARILAELESPYLVRFIDAGEDGEQLFMAMELVEGVDGARVLAERKRLSIPHAVRIVGDVCRGLAVAHRSAIIHRDIKPANMIIGALDDARRPGVVARLVDFGIARHIDERVSLAVTAQGGVVGTPLYMAPEQAAGDRVSPETDVYALGATLFHYLAGRPVFEGPGTALIIAQHLNEVPPRLDDVAPDIPGELADLVAWALEKRTRDRPADAEVFLNALLEAAGQGAARIEAHPRAPVEERVRRFTFTWDLASSPEALWTSVSDTDRVNRAVGLGVVDIEHRAGDDDVEQHVKMQAAFGIEVAWREFPFEWVENRRFGVFREYSKGPFAWFKSVVDLDPLVTGGTRLTQVIEVVPRGLLGEGAARFEIGVRGKRGLDAVYRRIDALIQAGAAADPFASSDEMTPDGRARLALVEEALVRRGASSRAVTALGDHLRHVNAKDAARVRPLAFARRYGLERDEALRALLLAVVEGALVLKWDLLCPTCRIASEMVDALAALKSHGHCDACNLDYELDLARSVELVLSAHPSIRVVELGTYCASSPGHSPHVKARVRVAADEELVLPLALGSGAYRVTGRHLPFTYDFLVEDGARVSRVDLDLGAPVPPGLPRALSGARQTLALQNTSGREQVVRVESRAPREDAFTAADAAASAIFREHFKDEVLDGGRLMGASHVVIVAVDLVEPERLLAAHLDERDVYAKLAALYVALDADIARHGGSVLRVRDPGLLAAFPDALSAVQWAASARGAARELSDLGAPIRVGVHQGAARLVTLNGRLDFFGATVLGAVALAGASPPLAVLVSEEVLLDPGVSRFVDDAAARCTIVRTPLGSLGLTMPIALAS